MTLRNARCNDKGRPQGSVYIKQIRHNNKVTQNQVFLPSLTTMRCPKSSHRPACSSHNEAGCVSKYFLPVVKLGFNFCQELELFCSPPRSNCFRVSSCLLSSGCRYLHERYSNRRQEITTHPCGLQMGLRGVLPSCPYAPSWRGSERSLPFCITT